MAENDTDKKPKLIKPPKSFTSVVWKHFMFTEDKRNTVCNHCSAVVPYKAQTTNMFTHMRRHHPSENLTQPGHGMDTDQFQMTFWWLFIIMSWMWLNFWLGLQWKSCNDLKFWVIFEESGVEECDKFDSFCLFWIIRHTVPLTYDTSCNFDWLFHV